MERGEVVVVEERITRVTRELIRGRGEILGVRRHGPEILCLRAEELSSLLMKRRIVFQLRKVERPILIRYCYVKAQLRPSDGVDASIRSPASANPSLRQRTFVPPVLPPTWMHCALRDASERPTGISRRRRHSITRLRVFAGARSKPPRRSKSGSCR